MGASVSTRLSSSGPFKWEKFACSQINIHLNGAINNKHLVGKWKWQNNENDLSAEKGLSPRSGFEYSGLAWRDLPPHYGGTVKGLGLCRAMAASATLNHN